MADTSKFNPRRPQWNRDEYFAHVQNPKWQRQETELIETYPEYVWSGHDFTWTVEDPDLFDVPIKLEGTCFMGFAPTQNGHAIVAYPDIYGAIVSTDNPTSSGHIPPNLLDIDILPLLSDWWLLGALREDFREINKTQFFEAREFVGPTEKFSIIRWYK